jgi:hypothetical protein
MNIVIFFDIKSLIKVSMFCKAHMHGTFLASVDLFLRFSRLHHAFFERQIVDQEIKKRCSGVYQSSLDFVFFQVQL